MVLQRFALDRWGRASYYLALVSVGSACSGGPAPLVPEPLPPIEWRQVAEWVSRFQPTRALRYDLRWVYATQQGRSRGRAAILLVPPDSARFDYRGPFGRSGAAVVIGDSVLWAQPEDDVGGLVETAPLFWALVGIPRMPPARYAVSGRSVGEERVWRFASLLDTLTFALRGDRLLQAEMRHAGKLVGFTETKLDEATGLPIEGRMTFPAAAALFNIEVAGITELQVVDETIWKEP